MRKFGWFASKKPQASFRATVVPKILATAWADEGVRRSTGLMQTKASCARRTAEGGCPYMSSPGRFATVWERVWIRYILFSPLTEFSPSAPHDEMPS